jgi:hypothetical protein
MLRIEIHYSGPPGATKTEYRATYGLRYYAWGVCPLRAAAHVLWLAAGMEEQP